MRGGAEFGGALVEREMRGRKTGITRRSRMKIVGPKAEPIEHVSRHDDAGDERDQPRGGERIRLQRVEVGQRFDRDDGREWLCSDRTVMKIARSNALLSRMTVSNMVFLPQRRLSCRDTVPPPPLKSC